MFYVIIIIMTIIIINNTIIFIMHLFPNHSYHTGLTTIRFNHWNISLAHCKGILRVTC